MEEELKIIFGCILIGGILWLSIWGVSVWWIVSSTGTLERVDMKWEWMNFYFDRDDAPGGRMISVPMPSLYCAMAMFLIGCLGIALFHDR